jgi:hypothetical protein
MLFCESKLPWNDLPVMSAGNLHQRIAEGLSEHLQMHLPKSIEVMFDAGVPEQRVIDFIDALPPFLEGEFSRWQQRLKRFTELKLLTESEIRHFMTAQRDVQPWILYYSLDGGLGHETSNSDPSLSMGLIPCSAVKHHGVAWRRAEDGELKVWLASARRKGSEDWDWMADIGHEVCHASFAPVPLSAQPSTEAINADISLVNSLDELQPQHIQKIAYTKPEIVATVIRGEYRDTETGLPSLETKKELNAFLEICNYLYPDSGFSFALQSFAAIKSWKVDRDMKMAIFYEIAACCLKAT